MMGAVVQVMKILDRSCGYGGGGDDGDGDGGGSGPVGFGKSDLG